MKIAFYKYQGTGNDFVMIDNLKLKLEHTLTQEIIARICHRRFGIGADGLILLSPSENAAFRMIYYNADGNSSTFCGNGARCTVAFAHKLGLIQDSCTFEAADGMHQAWVQGKEIKLQMQQPKGYKELSSNSSWLDTGSPHHIEFKNTSIDELDVYDLGKQIRYDQAYTDIGGTNVNFVHELENGRIKVRTYERGVENETFSCGTGVTAAAYAYAQISKEKLDSIHIETIGGQLEVFLKKDQMLGTEILFLQGPAEFVFEGTISI